MAYEDFTTFTEVDQQNTLTIVSSTKIKFDELYCNYNEIIYKDYGEWYFKDCELQVEAICTDIGNIFTTQKYSSAVILGLANTYHQMSQTSGHDQYGEMCLEFFNPTADDTDLDIRLANFRFYTFDTYAAASVNTRYYFTMTVTHADSSVTVYIYDDAPRTNLLDTLTVNIIPEIECSYLHCGGAVRSYQNPASNMSGEIDNLEIISGGETPPTDPLLTSKTQLYPLFFEKDSNNEITIVGPAYCKTEQMERKNSNYLIKYYGTQHFGDFLHQVDSSVTEIIHHFNYVGVVAFWGVGNNLATAGQSGDMSCYFYNKDYNDLFIILASHGLGSDTYGLAVWGYTYYFSIQRSGPTLTCEIYKEKERTTLLDTLTTSCVTDKYKYCYGVSAIYSSENRPKLSVHVENLKFLEVIVPDEPGPSGPTDAASNAEFPTAELSVTIPDEESEVTVCFYDEYGNLIGCEEGVGGETIIMPWDDLECESTHGWYVSMENEYGTSYSDIWYFTCGSCSTFTIASESHPTIHLSPPRWEGEDRKLIKDLQSFNFWSEDWAIHDNGVDREPLILWGIEWIDDNGDTAIFHAKFNDIHDIMNKHEEVAISGLGDCIDGYYFIKNFHFATIEKCPRAREWKLELEFSRDKTW